MICATLFLKKGNDPSYVAPMRSPLPTWQSSNNSLNVQIYGYFNSMMELRLLYPLAEVVSSYETSYIAMTRNGIHCPPADFDAGKYVVWSSEDGKKVYAVPLPKAMINAEAKVIAAFRTIFEGFMRLHDALNFRESVARGMSGMLEDEEAVEFYSTHDPYNQRVVQNHIKVAMDSTLEAIGRFGTTKQSRATIDPVITQVTERFTAMGERADERLEVAFKTLEVTT